MSRKLVVLIQDIKGLPGKYKRVLQAWASFANNDGTNIFASKETVAARAGISRWTVYENTDDLIAAGAMQRASGHTCKTEKCDKGGTHFTSQHGQYTVVYRINVALLENPTVLIQKLADPTIVKPRKVTVGKSRKVTVVKPDATQALKDTPATAGQDEPTPPLVPNGNEGKNEVNEDSSSLRSSSSFDDLPHESVRPLETEPTPVELTMVNGCMYDYWREKTKLWFKDYMADDEVAGSDMNAGIRLVREYGWETVWDVLVATWQCPKTAGIGWKDFWYWCQQFELTQRTITTWRNKLTAMAEAKAAACEYCQANGSCPKHVNLEGPKPNKAPVFKVEPKDSCGDEGCGQCKECIKLMVGSNGTPTFGECSCNGDCPECRMPSEQVSEDMQFDAEEV